MSIPTIRLETKSLPVEYTEISQALASLFNLEGGIRIYGLDAGSRNVRVYLPPPTGGTTLIFLRVDVATAGYTATILGKSTAHLLSSASGSVALEKTGDCIILVPDDDLSTWIPGNRGHVLR